MKPSTKSAVAGGCIVFITIFSMMLVIACAMNFLMPISCAVADKVSAAGRKVAEKIEYSGRK